MNPAASHARQEAEKRAEQHVASTKVQAGSGSHTVRLFEACARGRMARQKCSAQDL